MDGRTKGTSCVTNSSDRHVRVGAIVADQHKWRGSVVDERGGVCRATFTNGPRRHHAGLCAKANAPWLVYAGYLRAVASGRQVRGHRVNSSQRRHRGNSSATVTFVMFPGPLLTMEQAPAMGFGAKTNPQGRAVLSAVAKVTCVTPSACNCWTVKAASWLTSRSPVVELTAPKSRFQVRVNNRL